MIINAATKKIIPDPLVLLTIAKVTMAESDDRWMEVARRWLPTEHQWTTREQFMLRQFRNVLQNVSALEWIETLPEEYDPSNGKGCTVPELKIIPVHKMYRFGDGSG